MKISPPAFPTWVRNEDMTPGMTLLDYFATQAMLAAIMNPEFNSLSKQKICEYAFSMAQTMMQERQKCL